MKQTGNILIFLGAFILAQNVMAVKIVECEDEQGNITYQDRCPPGSKPINQKEYSVNPGSAATDNDISEPLTLYLVPECDTCEQVKEFLTVRKIPFKEINVNDNYDLQQELKGKTGGDLRVPVLVIGETILTGYNRGQLLDALTKAGYIKAEEQAE